MELPAEFTQAHGSLLVTLLQHAQVGAHVAEATRLLEQSECAPGFCTLCLDLAMASTPPLRLELRQLAVISVRNTIRRHWSASRSGEGSLARFPGVVGKEEKASVRRRLLEYAMLEPEPKLVSLAILCIAKMARSDWPVEWQGLFPAIASELGAAVSAVGAAAEALAASAGSDLAAADAAAAAVPRLSRLLGMVNAIMKELQSKGLPADRKRYVSIALELLPGLTTTWTTICSAFVSGVLAAAAAASASGAASSLGASTAGGPSTPAAVSAAFPGLKALEPLGDACIVSTKILCRLLEAVPHHALLVEPVAGWLPSAVGCLTQLQSAREALLMLLAEIRQARRAAAATARGSPPGAGAAAGGLFGASAGDRFGFGLSIATAGAGGNDARRLSGADAGDDAAEEDEEEAQDEYDDAGGLRGIPCGKQAHRLQARLVRASCLLLAPRDEGVAHPLALAASGGFSSFAEVYYGWVTSSVASVASHAGKGGAAAGGGDGSDAAATSGSASAASESASAFLQRRQFAKVTVQHALAFLTKILDHGQALEPIAAVLCAPTPEAAAVAIEALPRHPETGAPLVTVEGLLTGLEPAPRMPLVGRGNVPVTFLGDASPTGFLSAVVTGDATTHLASGGAAVLSLHATIFGPAHHDAWLSYCVASCFPLARRDMGWWGDDGGAAAEELGRLYAAHQQHISAPPSGGLPSFRSAASAGSGAGRRSVVNRWSTWLDEAAEREDGSVEWTLEAETSSRESSGVRGAAEALLGSLVADNTHAVSVCEKLLAYAQSTGTALLTTITDACRSAAGVLASGEPPAGDGVLLCGVVAAYDPGFLSRVSEQALHAEAALLAMGLAAADAVARGVLTEAGFEAWLSTMALPLLAVCGVAGPVTDVATACPALAPALTTLAEMAAAHPDYACLMPTLAHAYSGTLARRLLWTFSCCRGVASRAIKAALLHLCCGVMSAPVVAPSALLSAASIAPYAPMSPGTGITSAGSFFGRGVSAESPLSPASPTAFVVPGRIVGGGGGSGSSHGGSSAAAPVPPCPPPLHGGVRLAAVALATSLVQECSYGDDLLASPPVISALASAVYSCIGALVAAAATWSGSTGSVPSGSVVTAQMQAMTLLTHALDRAPPATVLAVAASGVLLSPLNTLWGGAPCDVTTLASFVGAGGGASSLSAIASPAVPLLARPASSGLLLPGAAGVIAASGAGGGVAMMREQVLAVLTVIVTAAPLAASAASSGGAAAPPLDPSIWGGCLPLVAHCLTVSHMDCGYLARYGLELLQAVLDACPDDALSEQSASLAHIVSLLPSLVAAETQLGGKIATVLSTCLLRAPDAFLASADGVSLGSQTAAALEQLLVHAPPHCLASVYSCLDTALSVSPTAATVRLLTPCLMRLVLCVVKGDAMRRAEDADDDEEEETARADRVAAFTGGRTAAGAASKPTAAASLSHALTSATAATGDDVPAQRDRELCSRAMLVVARAWLAAPTELLTVLSTLGTAAAHSLHACGVLDDASGSLASGAPDAFASLVSLRLLVWCVDAWMDSFADAAFSSDVSTSGGSLQVTTLHAIAQLLRNKVLSMAVLSALPHCPGAYAALTAGLTSLASSSDGQLPADLVAYVSSPALDVLHPDRARVDSATALAADAAKGADALQAAASGSAGGDTSIVAAAAACIPGFTESGARRKFASGARRRYLLAQAVALSGGVVSAADASGDATGGGSGAGDDGGGADTMAMLMRAHSLRMGTPAAAGESLRAPEREDDDDGDGSVGDGHDDVDGDDCVYILGAATESAAVTAEASAGALSSARCADYAAARQRAFASRVEIGCNLQAYTLDQLRALHAAIGAEAWAERVAPLLPAVTMERLTAGQ